MHRFEPTLLNVRGCIDLEEGGHASNLEDISAILADRLEAIRNDVDGDAREHGRGNDEFLNKVIDNDDIAALRLVVAGVVE